MKIALFTDGLFPEFVGGMQKHSLLLLIHLAKEGVEIDVYHPGKKLTDAYEQLPAEVRQRVNFISVPFPDSVKFPGHYLFNSYRYSKKVVSEFKKQQSGVDFVYAQGFSGWYYSLNKTSLMPPVGVNFHGLEMFQEIAGNQVRAQQNLLKPFARKVIRNADVVFSLGGKLSNIIHALSPKGKLMQIPIGIDESWVIDENEIKIKEGKMKFLFVGRNEWRKGLHILNGAIQNLEESGLENIEFGFVGDIPDKMHTTKVVCRYFGQITDEVQLQQLFQQHDVLVCPSLAEGMPTVILEAMANGLAIIATDTGATAELVDKENGRLIESGNQNMLEKALAEYSKISKADLSATKRASIQKVKERFLWPQVAKKTISEIKQFLRSRG